MWKLIMFLINGSNNSKKNLKNLKLKWKYTYKILWDVVNSSKREVHSNKW